MIWLASRHPVGVNQSHCLKFKLREELLCAAEAEEKDSISAELFHKIIFVHVYVFLKVYALY